MTVERHATAGRQLLTLERRRLSDEEEQWIARQLARAPSADPARQRIEQLLALPPDRVADARSEPRAS
jgi:hypothetical protein